MKPLFSIIVPSYNSGNYIEQTITSILAQRKGGTELELIVVDGVSEDTTPDILEQFKNEIDHLIVEPDTGPANAINKGLKLAKGEVLTWLNADDLYLGETLQRVALHYTKNSAPSFYFGACAIINEHGEEVRTAITRFKELFFPVHSRFVHQCINYISQPACFFTRSAFSQAGGLREDMVAAWDYEFFLRLWHVGKGKRVLGPPLSAFRSHAESISSQQFRIQFREELEAAKADAGKYSFQYLLHQFVRLGIVGAYSSMSAYSSFKIGKR